MFFLILLALIHSLIPSLYVPGQVRLYMPGPREAHGARGTEGVRDLKMARMEMTGGLII